MTIYTIYNKTKETIITGWWEIHFSSGNFFGELTLDVAYNQSVDAMDEIQIKEDDEVIFGGYAFNGGTYQSDGMKTIKVNGYGQEIMQQRISIDLENTSPEEVISEALSGTDYTFRYAEATGIAIDHYSIFDTIGKCIREMIDRTGWTVRITPSKEIWLEPFGYRNTGYSYIVGTDGVEIVSWEKDRTVNIENRIRVIGQSPVKGLTIDKWRKGTVSGTATNKEGVNDNYWV